MIEVDTEMLKLIVGYLETAVDDSKDIAYEYGDMQTIERAEGYAEEIKYVIGILKERLEAKNV